MTELERLEFIAKGLRENGTPTRNTRLYLGLIENEIAKLKKELDKK